MRNPKTFLLAALLSLALSCPAQSGGRGGSRDGGGGRDGGLRVPTPDIYDPYRYQSNWSAETLYVGPEFVYTGKGPIRISLKNSETSAKAKLYVINPATNDTIDLFYNWDNPGVAVDVSALTKVPVGGRLVFMYVPDGGVPRFTGDNSARDRYYNSVSSDDNVNRNLRFGHRFSVGGKVNDSLVEFGFEDDEGRSSDMDFNDIIFQAENLQLVAYVNTAKARAYIW